MKYIKEGVSAIFFSVLLLNDLLSFGSSYTITYDGNGATSGSMPSQTFELSQHETTRLQPLGYERTCNVLFDTNGGDELAPVKCKFQFGGWKHEHWLTEVTNDIVDNWTDISLDIYGNNSEQFQFSDYNGVNNFKVNTIIWCWEKVYSRAIYMPKGTYTLSFKECSPTGCIYWGTDWDVKFKLSACSKPQTEYGNDSTMLSRGSSKCAVLIDMAASTTMKNYTMPIYSDGGPVYLVMNFGNLNDLEEYEFNFSDFVLSDKGSTTRYYMDEEATSQIVREDGGNIVLKAQWIPSDIELPEPTRKGYIFKGWSTEADGSGTLMAAGSTYTADMDTQLYAVWEKEHTSSQLTVTICEGESYILADQQFDKGGEYNVDITADSSVQLTLNVLPKVITIIDTTILMGDELLINGESVKESGDYQEVEQSAMGCDSIIKYNVTVQDTSKKLDVVPGIIVTANGDGLNDTWEIENLSRYTRYKVEIFDRNGKEIGKYIDSYQGFDGYYHGHRLPSADYWYIISLEDTDKVLTGHFTLLWGI